MDAKIKVGHTFVMYLLISQETANVSHKWKQNAEVFNTM